MAQHCPECGTKLKSDARFCPSCGTAVRGGRSGRKRATTRGPRWPLIAIVGGGAVLIVIGLVMALPGGGRAETQVAGPPPDEHGAEGIPYPSVERITVEEAYAMIQSGEALLVDVRDRAAYTEMHAENALSMPEAELPDRISELPRDRLIITYCT